VSHSPALVRVGVVLVDGSISEEPEFASEGVLRDGGEGSRVLSSPLLELGVHNLGDFSSGDTDDRGSNE
jgi:hypothetical protein